MTIDDVRAWFLEVERPGWPVPADEFLAPIADLMNRPEFHDPEFRRVYDEAERKIGRDAAARAKRVIAAVDCLLEQGSTPPKSPEAPREVKDWLSKVARRARQWEHTRSPWHFLAWTVFNAVIDAWHDSGRRGLVGRGNGSPAVLLVKAAFRAVGEVHSESAVRNALHGWSWMVSETDRVRFEDMLEGDFYVLDGRRVRVTDGPIVKDQGTEPKKNRGRPPGKVRQKVWLDSDFSTRQCPRRSKSDGVGTHDKTNR